MSTRERLLALLQDADGAYLSGEEIAEKLCVSRAAIWKAAQALRQEGFVLEAAQNRGYRLAAAADALSAAGITRLLNDPQAFSVTCLPSVTSTNAALRERANNGAAEGEVIVAAQQTAGRGRMGRAFFSPGGTGLYLSLLLRPKALPPAQAVRITTMAAVAACQAIEALVSVPTQIKWVNDILIDGRKVGGILTEGSFHLETGALDFVILGVGINLYPPAAGFPAELTGVAGYAAAQPLTDGRNRLAAAFLDHFLAIYRDGSPDNYARLYREKSFVIGRRVFICDGKSERPATALDIDRECRLVVRLDDGSIETLSSAEVRVRPDNQ